MVTMEPILARIAHDHELISLVGLAAVTEFAKMVLRILVHRILIILLVRVELASRGHPSVSAVTSELKPLPQIHQIMSFMTSDSASDTKAVRFSVRIFVEKLTEI